MRAALLPAFNQLTDLQKIWYRRCVLDTIPLSASNVPPLDEDIKWRTRKLVTEKDRQSLEMM
jgi:hypothetical protein